MFVAVGAAAGWCLGIWLAVRTPRWPPGQAADWQFVAVAAAGLAAVILSFILTRPSLRLAVGTTFFALFFTLLTHRFLAGLWPGPGAFLWPAGLVGIALLNVWAIVSVARSVQAAATTFGLLLFTLFASAALALGGSAVLGHSFGVLASVAGAFWIISWALRRQIDALPAAFVVTAISGGLLAQGMLFGGLKPNAAALFAAAWPAASVTVQLLRHTPGNLRVGLFLFTLAVFCGAGLVFASL